MENVNQMLPKKVHHGKNDRGPWLGLALAPASCGAALWGCLGCKQRQMSSRRHQFLAWDGWRVGLQTPEIQGRTRFFPYKWPLAPHQQTPAEECVGPSTPEPRSRGACGVLGVGQQQQSPLVQIRSRAGASDPLSRGFLPSGKT